MPARISGSWSRLWPFCPRRSWIRTAPVRRLRGLFYVYADTLLALGRDEEALQWFLRSAGADVEGVTDAEDRVEELGTAETP